MKLIHVHESIRGPVAAAIRQVLGTMLDPAMFAFTPEPEAADFVLLKGNRHLERVHSHDKRYLLLAPDIERPPSSVPENVQIMPRIGTMVVDIFAALSVDVIPKVAATGTPAADALRVLVIDDSPKNAAAAVRQLGGKYRLRVCSTYLQGLEAIQAGQFDVVLTDYMLPASSETLGEEAARKFAGQEMALGWMLGLLAAEYGGKRVAVVTDLGHHDHPMSAALDHLLSRMLIVNGSKLVFYNRPSGADGKDWEGVLRDLLAR